MPDRDFDLGQQIARLQGTVEEGFKGVHARQDTTNGRIGKAETRIAELEKAQNIDAGRRGGINASWAVLISILSLAVAILAIFFH